MPCKEIKSTKYQTRKSPPFHARDCKNLTKKGKDGEYVSKADSKGIYKWVKARGATRKAGKAYIIHDNGARPYRVEEKGCTVEIYKGAPTVGADGQKDYDNYAYDTLVKRVTVKKVHVGTSSCIAAADACGKFAYGNTVLLHLSGKKYMHVGREIFQFTIKDDFVAYYSMLGNNDVPYPVLLGSEYVYFMLDKECLPRSAFKAKMTAAEWEDAYSYFLGFKSFDTGERIECAQKGLKERTKCIKERGAVIQEITKKYARKYR